MTQTDIISRGYKTSKQILSLSQYSDYSIYRRGALYAFEYVRRQFEELMEEWYGDDFQEEREEMTRLFEERIGIEK